MTAFMHNLLRGFLSLWRIIHGREANAIASERVRLLEDLETELGYSFKDKEILNRALSHRSYIANLNGSELLSYERLEFLGDSALGLIVSEFLFRANPGLSEGDLTRTKSSLVSREALVRCAEKLSLERYILLTSKENLLKGRARMTILADCFEALLGAIYIDGGIDPAADLVKRLLLSEREAMSPFHEFHQAKNKLLRIAQEAYQVQPEYRITEANGPEHDRVFTCAVSISGETLGSGFGKSKKEAEKWAAVDALRNLETEKIKNDNHQDKS
ncbi:MAG: ribonuclease III [Candidatus Glassbacteria bacterium]